MKPVYGVPDADNHWFTIYHAYDKDILGIKQSTYDLCLFFISGPTFGIVGIQTDDILILVDNNFTSIKEEAIKLVKIMTKNRKYLTSTHPLKFNDT